MDVIDARQAPDLLIRRKFNPQRRMPRQHAPPISMAMNDQLTLITYLLDAGNPHAVQTDHDAWIARCRHLFVASEHGIYFAGDVEGVHYALAGLFRVLV